MYGNRGSKFKNFKNFHECMIVIKILDRQDVMFFEQRFSFFFFIKFMAKDLIFFWKGSSSYTRFVFF